MPWSRYAQVCADTCELLSEAVAHRGNSEPVFHLFRVLVTSAQCWRQAILLFWIHTYITNCLESKLVQTARNLQSADIGLQNGVCKDEHVVLGANTPLLNALIMDLTKTPPDADELEVRFTYILTGAHIQSHRKGLNRRTCPARLFRIAILVYCAPRAPWPSKEHIAVPVNVESVMQKYL